MERKPRAYKISDEDYNRAMGRAQKNGHQLATLIETFVIMYGQYGTLPTVGYESKTDPRLPGLTAGMKQVVVNAQSAKEKPATKPVQAKELKPEVIGKPYSPDGNPRYQIINGKKVFK